MSKPFGTRVLVARVAALLRRSDYRDNNPNTDDTRTVGMLSLDHERLEVSFKNTKLSLTVSEFYLIQALTNRPGVVLSRDQILDKIRGGTVTVDHRIVDTYVRRLRRKFENVEPNFESIETVIGVGYRWKQE